MSIPPRKARRAAWRAANRVRGNGPFEFDESTRRVVAGGLGFSIVGGYRRLPRTPWSASGQRLPALSPLQSHLRAKGRLGGGASTLAVSLGFNRAQRRALKSKKGPRRMLEHGRPTSTPAQSFLPGKGTWNRFALQIEARRRMEARVERVEDKRRREGRWWRRFGRWMVSVWRRLFR